MDSPLFDYGSDPVLRKGFELDWIKVSKALSSVGISYPGVSYSDSDSDAVKILGEFLNKYHADFFNMAYTPIKPESPQEKIFVRKISNSLEYYSNWLGRIVVEMGMWNEERWSVNLSVMQELSNSDALTQAQGRVRTYQRVEKGDPVERLKSFDVVFVELRKYLRIHITEISKAKSLIK